MAEFEPQIVAFCCNWCTYAAADLAGTSRVHFPPNVKILRVMCSGMVNPIYILKAFEGGAAGEGHGHGGLLRCCGFEANGRQFSQFWTCVPLLKCVSISA